MVSLIVNGRTHSVDADPRTPLLWVLREQIGLTGTKYGCGAGLCGACAVHLNGALVRSCQIPLEAAKDQRVTTIEGLSPDGDHPVQRAWIAENVPQCGYCQSGQIMAAVDLLARNPHPSDAQIDEAMSHVCRCGTYRRIRRAIHRAAQA
jgi:aerobic-type carbon monoxide dehydrogenase small subunit (CoxS/CutS family)